MNLQRELASLKMADTIRHSAHLQPTGDTHFPSDPAFNAIFDSSEEALVVVDSSGEIQRANGRARELLRLKEAAGRDAALADFLTEPPMERVKSFWEHLTSGDRSIDASLAGGFPIRITLRSILPNSKHLLLCMEEGSIEAYSDVSEHRQNQTKMLQTEKMAALGQLVSGIAHELNNPLTAIMGYTQLLLGHGLAQLQLSEAKKIYQAADRARRIVKDLLYFARENKPERMRVDVNEIIERTLALRSYELRVENIVVHCDLAPGLPQTMADPYQIQQVILNLLINAEQALLREGGQGQIWIRTACSAPKAGRLGSSRILLEVSDDGPGIPPDIASRVFDLFFTTKSAGVGTGLGLSIVYGIVHQHDGEVTFENQPGSGVKLTVDLPVVSIPAPETVALAPEPARPSPPVSAGRILVVEDEPAVAQLIVDVLREEGHHVESVIDSQEGLARLSRTSYELVICDLRMPRLDGPAFFDALVQAGSPIRNKILFITGDTLAPRSLEFLQSKGLPYLDKPFLVEELKLAVNGLLATARKQTSRARTAITSNQTADPGN
jgi:signal transduction histidine kinase/ActR/RegA family two-component response regulator